MLYCLCDDDCHWLTVTAHVSLRHIHVFTLHEEVTSSRPDKQKYSRDGWTGSTFMLSLPQFYYLDLYTPKSDTDKERSNDLKSTSKSTETLGMNDQSPHLTDPPGTTLGSKLFSCFIVVSQSLSLQAHCFVSSTAQRFPVCFIENKETRNIKIFLSWWTCCVLQDREEEEEEEKMMEEEQPKGDISTTSDVTKEEEEEETPPRVMIYLSINLSLACLFAALLLLACRGRCSLW